MLRVLLGATSFIGLCIWVLILDSIAYALLGVSFVRIFL